MERIDISGNVRTMDEVIRREFRFAEDAFNAAKPAIPPARFRTWTSFEGLIEQVPGSAPDKAVVKVAVEEKSTGSLSIGTVSRQAAASLATSVSASETFLVAGKTCGRVCY